MDQPSPSLHLAGLPDCRCLLLVAAALLAFGARAAEYKFIDLGTLGGDWATAYDINDARVVVGVSASGSGRQTAVRWAKGIATSLGPEQARAAAINSKGVIVGTVRTPKGKALHAARWRHLIREDLGTLGGTTSDAHDINDAGWIVGASDLPGVTERHATLWRDGALIDLGTLGGSFGVARAVNNAGLIAGYSTTNDGASHATLWLDGVPTDLGTLGGTASYAYAINNAGTVVGCSSRGGNETWPAALWANGEVVDLGTLGGKYACAYGINDAGVVVGYSWLRPEKGVLPWHAVLWKGTTIHDLNDEIDMSVRKAGWVLRQAWAINTDGVIVGEARNKLTGADQRAFMLVPRRGELAGAR